MLQQTRVAAVIPYYERFLLRFPDIADLADAPEPDLLAAWAGLGYYSRARNLQQAARLIVAAGRFPDTYEAIRALPGVGDYTAAAVASIAFGLPHAAVDGNVLRVLARVTADSGDTTGTATRHRIRAAAAQLLDLRRPGDFNQALMELGATICLPRDPQCLVCPWTEHCEARRQGIAGELPIRKKSTRQVDIDLTVVIAGRAGKILLRQRPADDHRMPGFWELPEEVELPGSRRLRELGRFQHHITFHRYRVTVVESEVVRVPERYHWVRGEKLGDMALSTIARKAVGLL